MHRSLLICHVAVLLGVLTTGHSALAQPASGDDAERVRQARAHFERGVAYVDREAWQAALVEFSRSRELRETKANTKNAAICLRKVQRYDEALTLLEHLLRDFADLAASEREQVQREITELQGSVGFVQLSVLPERAQLSVDGTLRPLSDAPSIRLSVGAHTIRVTHDGFLPFERRVDVVSAETQYIEVMMVAVISAARLRLSSADDVPLALFVDGERVGTTPWEGALAPGVHTLHSLGSDGSGTPPQRITTARGSVQHLKLRRTALAAPLHVNVEPKSAEIAIDGANMGRGSVEVQLLPGIHTVSAHLPGYVAETRSLTLSRERPTEWSVKLEPVDARSAKFVLELRGAMALGLVLGGDLRGSCARECRSLLPIGGSAQLRAGYLAASGFGLGVHAGYLSLRDAVWQRRTQVTAIGFDPSPTVVDDTLHWDALLVGVDSEYVFAARWSLALRMGVGALIASVDDVRIGGFNSNVTEKPYGFAHVIRTDARYLYVAPEARLERKLGAGISLSFGLQLMVMTALQVPVWTDQVEISVGADGNAVFASQDLAGRWLLLAQPVLSVSYTF